jgi:glycosyltransferase involved in cell wall biosynthesis
MKRLLVINQYFPPDFASTGQYAFEICKSIGKEGIEVHVVTGQPSYTSSSPDALPYERLEGIHIYRVPLGKKKGRENFRIRITTYLRFLIGSWFSCKKLLKSKKFHYILTFHNPPFVGILGAYFAKKYKISFFYIPYDIHPDILEATGWKLPSFFIWLWNKINNYIFSNSQKIIVISEGMKDILVQRKKVPSEKIEVIPLWAQPEIEETNQNFSIKKELGINDDELLFLYSGNMGTLHNLDLIIDAARLTQNLNVKFVFVGDGIKRKHLISRVMKEGLENVKFLPYQPKEKYENLLLSSDACFVVINPEAEKLAFPSKAFTFLSAGKPIIAVMSDKADLARLIDSTGCGWVVNNVEGLSTIIREISIHPEQIKERANKAKEIYNKFFKKEIILVRYKNLFVQERDAKNIIF